MGHDKDSARSLPLRSETRVSRRVGLWMIAVTAAAVWAFLLNLIYVEVGNIVGPPGAEHSPVLIIGIVTPLTIGLTWAWWRVRSQDRAEPGGAL